MSDLLGGQPVALAGRYVVQQPGEESESHGIRSWNAADSSRVLSCPGWVLPVINDASFASRGDRDELRFSIGSPFSIMHYNPYI
ncbi:hypothetical protein GCM10027203_51930 [Nonomuraea fastidiosa]